jgi:hypothetical protein
MTSKQELARRQKEIHVPKDAARVAEEELAFVWDIRGARISPEPLCHADDEEEESPHTSLRVLFSVETPASE